MTETKVIEFAAETSGADDDVLTPPLSSGPAVRHRRGRQIDLVSSSDLRSRRTGQRRTTKRRQSAATVVAARRARSPRDLVRVACASVLVAVASFLAATHRVSRFKRTSFV